MWMSVGMNEADERRRDVRSESWMENNFENIVNEIEIRRKRWKSFAFRSEGKHEERLRA